MTHALRAEHRHSSVYVARCECGWYGCDALTPEDAVRKAERDHVERMATLLETMSEVRVLGHHPHLAAALGTGRYVATCSCGWEGKAVKATNAVAEFLQHLARFRSGTGLPEELCAGECPTPHKLAHPNKKQAENAMRQFWRRRRGVKMPVRVYHCPCGRWHTTSTEDRNAQ